MLTSGEAERVVRRYADTLYRLAILRDPHPRRAQHAVVTAFAAMRSNAGPANEAPETRLVACLPPLPRFRMGRSRSTLRLPPQLAALTGPVRLALGLRLFRGLSTGQIAEALDLPPGRVERQLIDAGRHLCGETGELAPACYRCWTERLDDPYAERIHLLTCLDCRHSIPAWEEAERILAESLGALLNRLTVPGDMLATLVAALQVEVRPPAGPLWRRPAILQGALITCLLAGLLVIALPRSGEKAGPAETSAVRPGDVIAAAEQRYTTVPHINGTLYRRWNVSLAEPSITLQADEWVDPQHPEHHRMQLMADRRLVEWEVGDANGHLLYMSRIAPYLCGAAPPGMQSYVGTRNGWAMGPEAQAAMRVARWEHGLWATGLRFLQLAATADTVRSLGLVGSGSHAQLTLAAEGRTISGTLLLRFDPASSALEEVHEIERSNGQTIERVPWRLLTSEASEPVSGGETLLTAYPEQDQPPAVEREGPIIDQACPLAGAAQTQSLPRLLMQPAAPTVIGLPDLPPGITQTLIIGRKTSPAAGDEALPAAGDLQVVYSGPQRRLVLAGETAAPRTEPVVTAGPWQLAFLPPTGAAFQLVSLRLSPQATGPVVDGQSHALGVHVLAEGWSRAELITLLAAARPLTIEDWLHNPARFYDSEPMPPPVRAHLAALAELNSRRAGQTHHQMTFQTTRQAPFFAGLRDPYHSSATLWPAVRREESWVMTDVDGREVRALRLLRDTLGRVLGAQWHDGRLWHGYDLVSGSVITQPYHAPPQDTGVPLNGAVQWSWQSLTDGNTVADQQQPLAAMQAMSGLLGNDLASVDNWTLDLGTGLGIMRRVFGPDGRLREQELLAVANDGRPQGENHLGATVAATATVLLNRRVIEQDEWLPAQPDSRFVWSPPPGTLQTPDDTVLSFYPYFNEPPVLSRPLSEVAGTTPFPVWEWTPNLPVAGVLTPGLTLQRPPRTGAFPPPLIGNIDTAVHLGVAVDTHYVLGGRSLELLQGPAPLLRQLLRQTAPTWTTAEERSIVLHDQRQAVWIMRGPADPSAGADRWLVLEMDGSLFCFRGRLEDSDVEVIIEHLDGLRRLQPQQAP